MSRAAITTMTTAAMMIQVKGVKSMPPVNQIPAVAAHRLPGLRCPSMTIAFPDVPLAGHTVTRVLWAVALAAVVILVLAQPRPRRIRTAVGTVAVSAALTATGLAVFLWGFHVPASQISPSVVVAAFLTLVGVLLGGAAVLSGWRRAWALVPMCVSLVTALLLVNQAFVFYPDTESLDPATTYTEVAAGDLPPAGRTVPVADWHPRRGLPRYGTVTTLDPANTASGFQARPASVYLPPAWYSDPRPQLPVLVLMPGIPGSPDQWFSQGAATQAADAWQLSHHGLAPVIITVDGSGGEWTDPLCTDSPRAKVRTYLTRDVPGWLVDRFGVTPDRSRWTIGGLSYGGTCSLQTILNAPDAYGSFLDFSGERTPNNGVDHESTVRDFFDGSEDAFRRQNPEDLLRSRPERFRSVAGRFVAGADDHDAVNDLRLLDGLAVGAGMDVSYTEVPGGHDFETWRTAVAQSLPFVAQRGGIG
ncbi:hypothetical protein CXF36_06665 [Corynebacterium bovis]|nr:hypothetical protein CXF36_06665 [Corynebacterium bovis]